MPKHRSGDSCESCDEKLLGADPKLRDWFLKKVKPMFPDAHVSWAHRDKENQNRAVAEGKSKLVYPKSKHNKCDASGKPCAQALDLFKLTADNKAVFPVEWYVAIAALADEKAGFGWGGKWHKFKDWDHFELI